MHQLTLQNLFGVNAVQDSQLITIKKADLPLLTPSANNTAESLLVAILLNAFRNFSGNIEYGFDLPITDETNQPIKFDNSDVYQALKIFRWEDKLISKNNLIYLRYTIVIEDYTIHENP